MTQKPRTHVNPERNSKPPGGSQYSIHSSNSLNASAGRKGGNKKKKSLQMTQQLGKLLKKENNKQGTGSLTDFLSSL